MRFRNSHLLIRADADIRMGTGHLMRCLALAQAWNDAGGTAIFLTACRLQVLNARLVAEGVWVESLAATPGSHGDAEETHEAARRLGAAWVVLDGYHFSGGFQRSVRQGGLRVLAIDDYGHAGHYEADLVLNQNLHAHEDLYRDREPYTGLLLGTRFALLRREFRKWHGWTREVPETARKVIVTLGGSDPDGVTLKVIEAIGQVGLAGLEAVIVVGAGNPRLGELEALAQGTASTVRVRTNITDMPELMAWADVAVAAGGTTTWERAMLGLPSLVIVLADNQKELAEASERNGIGWNLGPHQALSVPALADALRRLLVDAPARAAMARRGPEQIDGLGADRVLRRLWADDLRVRLVEAEDCRLIWEWANEPATRAASFSPEPIAWEQHRHWFTAKLNEPHCAFFVALDAEQQPIGQIRFDVAGAEAVISVGLAGRFHGLGYGPLVIRSGVRELFRTRPVERVIAFIRTENTRSLRAFIKAGFTEQRSTDVRGQPAHRLVLHRSGITQGYVP
jgi:UDP-2,4-diacetamido-2,4,6-trideoxy-beta-L-altropyranose hydrolase